MDSEKVLSSSGAGNNFAVLPDSHTFFTVTNYHYHFATFFSITKQNLLNIAEKLRNLAFSGNLLL